MPLKVRKVIARRTETKQSHHPQAIAFLARKMTAKPKTRAEISPIRERAIKTLRGLVIDALGERQATVYLFGSHARGEVRHASDIDVAILPREELPPSFFALLRDRIEESTIPYDVDLVDLREVSAAFRDNIVRTGIKWRD